MAAVVRAPKVLTVVGARPQFVKAAVVSPVLRRYIHEVLVHTGQHYDVGLSGIFFDALSIPRPDYQLDVGSDSHGRQTGAMLAALDDILEREQPTLVVVYGDTNSTLAGALAAAKQGIPVAHVEAGLRSFNRAMPEEINRVLTDHLAERLYCPTRTAVDNLAKEGIVDGVVLSGDVMDTAVRRFARNNDAVLAQTGVSAGTYFLATVHRQENTDDRGRLDGILTALLRLPLPVVWPLHPRTRERIRQFGWEGRLTAPIIVTEPVGYGEMLALEAGAAAVLTDSGGVQREASLLGTPVYVLRDETEWVELVAEGRAVLVGADPERIGAAVAAGAARGRPGLEAADPVERLVDDVRAVYG